MEQSERIDIHRESIGCAVLFGLILAGISIYLMAAVSLFGALLLVLALMAAMHRGGLVFERSRRKLIKWRGGMFPGETEFDLDRCVIRHKTANDSGIFHAVTLFSEGKSLQESTGRGREGFFSIRHAGKRWAELLNVPVFEASSGCDVPRDPQELVMSLPERLKRDTQPLMAPPHNDAIPVSHVDGKMVFDLSKSRQKLFISATELNLETNLYVMTFKQKIPFSDVMELEIKAQAKSVHLVTPEIEADIAAGYSEKDLHWLRQAILFSLAGLSR